MNKQKIYQVDAFTETLFDGNPAAVLPLKEWLSDDVMQMIAVENNLSETAFYCGNDLRWFTPGGEVDLCGHATMASAHVYFMEHPEAKEVQFNTRSGELVVRKDSTILEMDFPVIEVEDYTNEEVRRIYPDVKEMHFAPKQDVMLVVKNGDAVLNFDESKLLDMDLPGRGVVVTGPGLDGYDTYSRCFFPKYAVREDPFTGSAHCQIVPYWSKVLAKERLKVRQVAKRGGEAECWVEGGRVKLRGGTVLYMVGEILLNG